MGLADPESGLWTIILVTLLFAVACIDAKRLVIPDALNAALLAAGLVRCAAGGVLNLALAAAGAAAVFALFLGLRSLHARLRGMVGLGLGDVKFLAAASVWVGLDGVPVALLVACFSGLAYALIRKRSGDGLGWRGPIAFGPHLALGLASVWGAHASLSSSP